MNVTLVEINIKPERVDEFLEVFRANHEGAIKEPGNLRFDVLQDPRVKTRFFIYEAYKDEEAVLAHKQTPHYLACVDKLEELMSEPRKKRCFVGLLPEMVRYLPGGAALTGPTGVRWCGVCPVALTLTGPTGTVGVDFVGRVSEAPPGVVHASSSN